MKKFKAFTVFVAIFAFILYACPSDEDNGQNQMGPDFSISELAGVWEATAFLFTYSGQGPVPNPSFYNVIDEGGSATLTVQSNGIFVLNMTIPNSGPESFSGQMYFEDGEFFAIQFDEDPPDDPTYFGATLDGNMFSLNGGPDTAEWDFDGDDVDEQASVDMTFVRM